MEEYKNIGHEIRHILKADQNLTKGELLRLCSSDPEDGLRWQGKLVFGLSPDKAAMYWQYGVSHAFADSVELYGLGRRCQLAWYQVCALLLKGLWEEHVAAQSGRWRQDNSFNIRLEKILLKAAMGMMPIISQSFSPDAAALFRVLAADNFADAAGYPSEMFALLMQEMLLAKIYLFDLGSREFADFCHRLEEEMTLCQQGEKSDCRHYFQKKCQWLGRQNRLGEYLLQLEKKKTANNGIRVQWLAEFGQEYMVMMEEYENLKLYDMMLKLKNENSEMALDELQQAAEGGLRQAEIAMDERQDEIAIGQRFQKTEATEEDVLELAEMKNKCEKILRRIALLTHPDRLAHNADYAKMTKAQQQYIKDMFVKAREFGRDAKGCELADKVYWGGDKVVFLQSLLANIEEVYRSAGVDVRVELVVKGQGLEERLLFIKQEKKMLDDEIKRVKLLLAQQVNDQDIREKHHQLGSPEQYADVKDALLAQAEVYRQDVQAKQEALISCFKGRQVA